MTEFWELSFREKRAMWGFEPADCVKAALALFQGNGLKEILIPGFGYGRNAKIFSDHGFLVTGIEISQTAIDLARNYYGDTLKIYHGNVSDMPFDQKLYDGIFCYALIHLLDEKSRAKLICDCYAQLKPGGYMVFVTISKNTLTYGEGRCIGKDTFATKHGVNLYFYDTDSIITDFGDFGLEEVAEINEPANSADAKAIQQFWRIVCRKVGG